MMGKRALAIFFTLTLVMGLAFTTGALASTLYVYTGNGKSLNVRDYPSKDGNIIGSLAYGSSVEVDDGFVGSSWAHVYTAHGDGYCMFRYLVDYKPTPHPKPTTTPKPTPKSDLYSGFKRTYYSASVRPSAPGGFVHMRWAPSKAQPIHTDYYNGQNLLVIATNGEWCQVYDTDSNQAGFMMTAFLSRNK
ncbi:MAG: SH3 domain-containing protein [Candidatus Limiplasma sp.]|nr:SH3 domain-containing protein [Candidatus Limiplasma sp.]MEA5144850.1 SH3 domain-containing protein [Candidatus Limiplasma sp.]